MNGPGNAGEHPGRRRRADDPSRRARSGRGDVHGQRRAPGDRSPASPVDDLGDRNPASPIDDLGDRSPASPVDDRRNGNPPSPTEGHGDGNPARPIERRGDAAAGDTAMEPGASAASAEDIGSASASVGTGHVEARARAEAAARPPSIMHSVIAYFRGHPQALVLLIICLVLGLGTFLAVLISLVTAGSLQTTGEPSGVIVGARALSHATHLIAV